MKKKLGYIVSVLLAFSVCVAGSATQALANTDAPSETTYSAPAPTNNISKQPAQTSSIVTSASLSTTHFNDISSSSQLTMNFALPNGQFMQGSTSSIQLPAGFTFSTDYDFEVKASNGAPVAHAHINAAAGTLTLTYTNYVASHSDITGSITATVTTDREHIGEYGPKSFDIRVDGVVIPVGEVTYEPWIGDDPNEQIAKWGHVRNPAQRIIDYTVRVNGVGNNIHGATVSDTLESAGMSYVSNSFTIKRGKLSIDPHSKSYTMTDERDVTAQYPIIFNNTNTSFNIALGDIGTDGFYIMYQVQLNHDPVNQEKFRNTVRLGGNDGVINNDYGNTLLWQSASGEANGYHYSIVIRKTDEAGNPLAGAVFSVVRSSSGEQVGTITTGADGTGKVEGLLRDAYVIHEVTPPAGYLAADDMYVTADDLNNELQSVHLTMMNKKIPPSKPDKPTPNEPAKPNSGEPVQPTPNEPAKPTTKHPTKPTKQTPNKAVKSLEKPSTLPKTGGTSTVMALLALILMPLSAIVFVLYWLSANRHGMHGKTPHVKR